MGIFFELRNNAVDRLGFLKNFITNPNVQVGNFTYYDDPDGIDEFETKNVL